MSESERTKDLVQKSLSCLHMARAIDQTYPDPSKMPADKVEERKALLMEARRLKGMADVQAQQDDLEEWAATPNDHAAVKAGLGAPDPQKVDDATRGATALLQKAAFLKWLQKKDRSLEEKAALVENATGEVLVPHDIMTPIFKDLPHLGTFRRAGPLIRPTTSNKVDVRSLTSATAGWGKLELGVAATDVNVVPNTPADVIEVQDLMGLAQIGVDELADTDIDNLPGLIQQAVSLQFAQMEDDAFGNGNGTSKPWGLLFRATQASPLITQALTAGGADAFTADNLKSLPYRVPTVFRDNGAYFLSDSAAEAAALLKDSTSNYLWQPSARAGEPATWNGYPVYTLESLNTVTGTSTVPVVFGDVGLGYAIADRQQVTMQRLDERYAELGLVGFLFKLRVGGDVIRPKAFAKYIVP